MTQNVETTVEVTVGQGQTVSEFTTYMVTHNGTVYTTQSLVPVTTVVGTTESATGTASGLSTATAGANAKNGPAAALLAGILGLVALV